MRLDASWKSSARKRANRRYAIEAKRRRGVFARRDTTSYSTSVVSLFDYFNRSTNNVKFGHTEASYIRHETCRNCVIRDAYPLTIPYPTLSLCLAL